MSRPMDGDGTLSVSTGSPFRENADALRRRTDHGERDSRRRRNHDQMRRRDEPTVQIPTRAKLPTSPPLSARPRGGVIVLLPSYPAFDIRRAISPYRSKRSGLAIAL